jgi:hypothetical protein
MIAAVRLVLGGGGLAAAALCLMSFSYGPTNSPPTSNPPIDYVRLLISDTQQFNAAGQPVYIFEDQEIQMFTQLQATVFQSSQFYSGPAGQYIPPSPVSYLRVAALALDAIASNKARLASIKKLLDVQLDSSDAAIQLRATAAEYRTVDDDAGAFAIIEQVNNMWSFRDRFWKQVQRQSGP